MQQQVVPRGQKTGPRPALCDLRYRGDVAPTLSLVGKAPSEAIASATRLVVAAQSGDPEAQRALYARCFPWVERLAFRLAPHRGEAEDLMQDAFSQAFLQLDRLEDPSRFEPWLRRMVVGLAHKRARRLVLFTPFKRSTDPIDFDAFQSPEASPEARAQVSRILQALERVPAAARIAFVLRHVEGMTIGEVAEATETSETTVKRRIGEATERLEKAGVLS